MNIIKIEGISEAYPERVEGTIEWYFCKVSKDCFCDLYETEEIVKSNNGYLQHLEVLDKYLPWSAELPEQYQLKTKHKKCLKR